ncbi:MAG: hypothetical protein ACI9C4_000059 [Paraglaciecola sp.]|jgi:hypothetical protein
MLRKPLLLATALCSFATLALDVSFTSVPPVIDGQQDLAWQEAKWHPMPYLMAGTLPSSDDFSGRYRLLWDAQYLYLQAEITDDRLMDKTADPLVKYWDDDALEIFVDGDASGGIHQFNHTAMAYHIALDNQAVDIGDDQKAHLYNDHLVSNWKRQLDKPHTLLWEVAIKRYPNDYTDAMPKAPLPLKNTDEMGFMLAYCDNDNSLEREHFMGSHKVEAINGDKNRGYIDADVFGKIRLVK